MDTQLVYHLNVHQLQRRLPFISCKFRHNNLHFDNIAIVDGGATRTTFPIQRLPSALKQAIQPTDVTLTGVGGKCDLAGTIDFKVFLGDGDNVGHDVKVLITTSGVPALIGQDVLSNGKITSFTQDNSNGCIIFKKVNGTSHTATCLTDKAVKKHFDDHRTGGPVNQVMKGGNDSATTVASVSMSSSHDTLDTSTPTMVTESSTKPATAPTPPPSATFTELKQWLHTVKMVDIPDSNGPANQKLVTLLHQYEDVLGTPDSKLGTFKKTVRIPTNGESRSRPQFPIAQNLKQPFLKLIEKLKRDGVIEPCKDPQGFNSAVFPVPKKKPGEVRLVVNFRPTLNKVIKHNDPWTMPSVESVLKSIPRGCQYFACVDLRDGYFQLTIHEDDRHKTAFQVNNQCMQFVRVPMGLTSAGAIFSREVAAVINGGGVDNVLAYLDDILVYGRTEEEFFNALEGLLSVLRQNGLLLNGRKCEFLKTEVTFLGRRLSSLGVNIVPEYVSPLLELRAPKTKKEAQRLIGRLVWINSFLNTRKGENLKKCNFSSMMKPIQDTVSVQTPFKWTDDAEKSFKKIKKRLTSAQTIQFADFNLPFTLTTDASLDAAGAVLMQEGPDGDKRIIATASKKFSKTERNWSATEREAYAIKWGILKFSYFLANRPFVVFTDHRSLTYMDRREFNNPKIRRWQAELQQFSFVVQYIEGESNVFADMLSRDVVAVTRVTTKEDNTPAGHFKRIGNSKVMVYVPSWVDNDDVVDIDVNEDRHISAYTIFGNDEAFYQAAQNMELLLEQSKDLMLKNIIQALQCDKSPESALDTNDHRYDIFLAKISQFCLEPVTGVLQIQNGHKYQMVIPYHMRYHMLTSAHNDCNHNGVSRMQVLLNTVWWESKSDDIRHWCSSCNQCSRRKGRYGMRQTWPDGHLQRGSKPFDVVYLDFIQMPMSKGKRYCLTLECAFSRYVMVIPTAHDRAVDACNGLYQLYLQHRCIPRMVSTDRGTHFSAALFNEFCTMMGSTLKLHCPWRPQSTGNLERQHRTLKNAVFIVCNGDVSKWTDVISAVVSNMNAIPNAATGVSAHEVVTGRKPFTGIPAVDTSVNASDASQYVKMIKSKQHKVYTAVRIAAAAADAKADQINNHVIKDTIDVGDAILLHRPQSVQAQRTKQDWIGPYTVTKTNHMVIQYADEDGKLDWTHMSQVRKLTPRKQDLLAPSPAPPMVPSATMQRLAGTEPTSVVTPTASPPPAQSTSAPPPSTATAETFGPDVSAEHTIPSQQETSRPKRTHTRPKRLIETMDAKLKSYFGHTEEEDETESDIQWIPPPPPELTVATPKVLSTKYVSKSSITRSSEKPQVSTEPMVEKDGNDSGDNISIDSLNSNNGDETVCKSSVNDFGQDSDIRSIDSNDINASDNDVVSTEIIGKSEMTTNASISSSDEESEEKDTHYEVQGASSGIVSSHIFDNDGLNAFLNDVTIHRTINLINIKDYNVLQSLNDKYSTMIWPSQDDYLAVTKAKRKLAKEIISKNPTIKVQYQNDVKWPFVPLKACGSQRVTSLVKSEFKTPNGKVEAYALDNRTFFELAQACVQLELQLQRSDLENKTTLKRAMMKAPLQQNFQTFYRKNILYIAKKG